MSDCLYSYHLRRGRYAEWLEADTAGLAAAIACSDRVGERRIRTGIAAVSLFSRRLDDAISQLETALRLAEAEGDDGTVGSIHNMMSAAYGQNQRPAECERHALAAYELLQRSGELAGAVTCLLNAGLAQCDMGRYDDAVRTLESALGEARSHLSEEQELADVLANLATAYLGSGRTAEAMTTATEAIAIARQREHPMCEAEALVILGRAIRDADPSTAHAHVRRLIERRRPLQHARPVRLLVRRDRR
jgi:tetratricopeptide (TPR) repeat protein